MAMEQMQKHFGFDSLALRKPAVVDEYIAQHQIKKVFSMNT